MFELNELTGWWTGLLVSDPDWTQVNVRLDVAGDHLDGRYEVPAIEGQNPFTATLYGNWLNVEVPDSDPHGRHEFHVTVFRDNDRWMMHGVIPLPGEAMPFATITVFPVRDRNERLLGAWPFRKNVEAA